jgi:hypothetical protein
VETYGIPTMETAKAEFARQLQKAALNVNPA